MFERMIAGWAGDFLCQNPPTAALIWRDPDPRDPAADYRDRDWRNLYRGDLLDD